MSAPDLIPDLIPDDAANESAKAAAKVKVANSGGVGNFIGSSLRAAGGPFSMTMGMGGQALGGPMGGGIGAGIGSLVDQLKPSFVPGANMLMPSAGGMQAMQDPGQMARTAGKAALAGTGMGLAGMPIEAGAKAFSGAVTPWLMEHALRVDPKLLAQYPNLMDRVNELGLRVGDVTGKGGSRVAAKAAGQSATQLRNALSASAQTYQAADLAPAAEDLIKGLPASESKADAMKQAQAMIDNFVSEHPGDLSASDVKILKAENQQASEAAGAYRTNPNVPFDVRASLASKFNKSIADNAQSALEQIPGVADREAYTKSLIGANKALRAAELRRPPMMSPLAIAGITAAVLPHTIPAYGLGEGALAYGLSRAAMAPRNLSGMAGMMSDPRMAQLFQQAPWLFAAGANAAQPQGGSK